MFVRLLNLFHFGKICRYLWPKKLYTVLRGICQNSSIPWVDWYGHVKRMPEERIPKLIMEWIPLERRKRGRPRETWMEGVQAAMTTRNLEPDQWRNREEWRLVSGRRRQLL